MVTKLSRGRSRSKMATLIRGTKAPVTGHFQHIIKGQDTRAARGEILPAGDNPRRDRVQRGEASRTENLNHSTARSRAAAANGEPVVVDAAQCCRHVTPCTATARGSTVGQPGACACGAGAGPGRRDWLPGLNVTQQTTQQVAVEPSLDHLLSCRGSAPRRRARAEHRLRLCRVHATFPVSRELTPRFYSGDLPDVLAGLE